MNSFSNIEQIIPLIKDIVNDCNNYGFIRGLSYKYNQMDYPQYICCDTINLKKHLIDLDTFLNNNEWYINHQCDEQGFECIVFNYFDKKFANLKLLVYLVILQINIITDVKNLDYLDGEKYTVKKNQPFIRWNELIQIVQIVSNLEQYLLENCELEILKLQVQEARNAYDRK